MLRILFLFEAALAAKCEYYQIFRRLSSMNPVIADQLLRHCEENAILITMEYLDEAIQHRGFIKRTRGLFQVYLDCFVVQPGVTHFLCAPRNDKGS